MMVVYECFEARGGGVINTPGTLMNVLLGVPDAQYVQIELGHDRLRSSV